MSKERPAGREEILECQVMWEPDSKKNTQMDRFRAAVSAACGLALGECARGPGAPGALPRGPSDHLAEELSCWGRDVLCTWAFRLGPLLIVARVSRRPVSLSLGVGRP